MNPLITTMPFCSSLGFSEGNAALCVQASREAYSSVTLDRPATDTQVLLVERPDCFIIAFRGTSNLADWIRDANFAFEKIGHARIHRGFLTAILDVINSILQSLPTDKTKPILVTGHSLGGALAILCAWLLKTRGVTVHSVYTFGQPRVGDSVFAGHYDYTFELVDRTFRIVNEEDIVPRIPGYLLGYRHTGILQFRNALTALLGTSQLAVKPSLWTMALSDAFGLWREWTKEKQIALLDDHYIANYCALFNS